MTDEEITHQLTTFEEVLKHLATKEELQKLRADLITWIIMINLAVGGVVISVMVFLVNALDNKFTLLLQHWKP